MAYRRLLKKKDFAIISNNCWGGDLYQLFDLPFNSPFIGLFINAPCFIKLLSNPEHYFKQELRFITQSKYTSLNVTKAYPIGVLDDIEVHFLHYKTQQEAADKWTRRVDRLPAKEKWVVKFDDRDNCTPLEVQQFHAMPYAQKISFTKEKYPYDNNIKLNHPDDLILFHSTYYLVDIPAWINTGELQSPKGTLKKLHASIKFPKKF